MSVGYIIKAVTLKGINRKIDLFGHTHWHNDRQYLKNNTLFAISVEAVEKISLVVAKQ